MSKMAELAYDIEQLFIEGMSPPQIAKELGCPLSIVYDWLEAESLEDDETIDPAEWDQAFPQDPEYDPYSTVNS